MYWTQQLERILSKPCDGQRPFVCDGFPHESTVLIIGENPGQQTADWWRYWDSATGFDRAAFSEDYLVVKRHQKQDPHWNYRGTRARLQRLHELGVQAVETNKWRNEKLDGAGNRQQRILNDEVLELLVDGMPELRLVVAHGKPAQEFVAGFGLPHKVTVLNLPHFRSLGFDRLDEIKAAS